jgi:hypothetical protein
MQFSSGPTTPPFHSGFLSTTLHRNRTRFIILGFDWGTSVTPIPTDASERAKIIAYVPKLLFSERPKTHPVSSVVLSFNPDQLEKLASFKKEFNESILLHMQGKFASLVQSIIEKIQPPIKLVTHMTLRAVAQVRDEFKGNPSTEFRLVLGWAMRLLYSEKVQRLILAKDLMDSFGFQYLQEVNAGQGFVENTITDKRLVAFRPILNIARAERIQLIYSSSLLTTEMPQRIWNALPANLVQEIKSIDRPQFDDVESSTPATIAFPSHNHTQPPVWQPFEPAFANRGQNFHYPESANRPLTNPSARPAHHVHQPHFLPVGNNPGFQSHLSNPYYNTPSVSHNHRYAPPSESSTDDDHVASRDDPPAIRRRVVNSSFSSVKPVPKRAPLEQPIELEDSLLTFSRGGDDTELPSSTPRVTPVSRPKPRSTSKLARNSNKNNASRSKKKALTTKKTISTRGNKKARSTNGSLKNKSRPQTPNLRKNPPQVVLPDVAAKENLPQPVCPLHNCQIDNFLSLTRQDIRYYQENNRFMTNASCFDCHIPFTYADFLGVHYCGGCKQDFSISDEGEHTLDIFCSPCKDKRVSSFGKRGRNKKKIVSV